MADVCRSAKFLPNTACARSASMKAVGQTPHGWVTMTRMVISSQSKHCRINWQQKSRQGSVLIGYDDPSSSSLSWHVASPYSETELRYFRYLPEATWRSQFEDRHCECLARATVKTPVLFLSDSRASLPLFSPHAELLSLKLYSIKTRICQNITRASPTLRFCQSVDLVQNFN